MAQTLTDCHHPPTDSDDDADTRAKRRVKRASKRGPPLSAEHARISAEVAELVGEADADALAAAAAQGANKGGFTINPMAKILGPIQFALEKVVVPARLVRRSVMWHDRIVTTWAFLGLLGLTVLLALVPWRFLLKWGAKLLGLAALGPHMYCVGKLVAKRAAAAEAAEVEYQAATAAGRASILSRYRAELMKTAHDEVAEAAAKRAKASGHQKARVAYLLEAKHTLAVTPQRTSTKVKHVNKPDPRRSRAYASPFTAEHDAADARTAAAAGAGATAKRAAAVVAEAQTN